MRTRALETVLAALLMSGCLVPAAAWPDTSLTVHLRDFLGGTAGPPRGVNILLRDTSPAVLDRLVRDGGLRGTLVRFWLDFGVGGAVRDPALAAAISTVRRGGGIPLVVVGATPRHLASLQDERPQPGGWPRFAASPPRDMQAWGELVREAVAYLNIRQRAGVEFLEVWNEPDNPAFWGGTARDYLALYEATARAAKRVDPTIRVGGPGLTAWNAVLPGGSGPGIQALLRAARDRKLPLDFLSWHEYDADPWQLARSGAIPAIRAWRDEMGFPRAKLILSEWNRGIPHPHPLQGMDAPENASYLVTRTLQFLHLGVDYNAFFMLQDGPWEAKEEFAGQSLGLVTVHGVMKPSYHAFRLLGELGGQRLRVEQGGHPGISSLATRQEKEVYVLVAFHPREGGGRYSPETVRIVLRGEEVRQRRLRYGRYLVDDEHGNGFRVRSRIRQELESAAAAGLRAGHRHLGEKGYSPEVIDRYLRSYMAERSLPGSSDLPAAVMRDFAEAERVSQDVAGSALRAKADEINGWPEVALRVMEEGLVEPTDTPEVTIRLRPYGVTLLKFRLVE